MKFENWMIILITLSFGISSFSIAMAQIKNNQATDLVLESVINYENERILSDSDIKKLTLFNSQEINKVSSQVNTNYACLIAILGKEVNQFNKTLYDQILNSCKLELVNVSFPSLNTGQIDPIKDYSEELEEILGLRTEAFWWQISSLSSFMFALLFFILLLEKKAIEHYFSKKETKNE